MLLLYSDRGLFSRQMDKKLHVEETLLTPLTKSSALFTKRQPHRCVQQGIIPSWIRECTDVVPGTVVHISIPGRESKLVVEGVQLDVPRVDPILRGRVGGDKFRLTLASFPLQRREVQRTLEPLDGVRTHTARAKLRGGPRAGKQN